MPEHHPAGHGTVYRGLTVSRRQLLDEITTHTSLRDQVRDLNQRAKLGEHPRDVTAVRARLFDPGPTPT